MAYLLSSSDNKSTSNVLNAIELLRARWQGTVKTYDNIIKLSPDEYTSLWQHLESKEKELAEYIQYHVRSHYNPATFQFSVPMPLPVHEHLLASIRRDLLEQLSSIENDSTNPAAGLAKILRPGDSSTVFFDNGGHRDPNMQFTYPDRKYPSLIIEIAYSQSEKRSSLPNLADEYITESEGNILLVIGVELPYGGQKMGTISTWCPKFGTDDKGKYIASQQGIISQGFWNVDGTAVSGTALRIPFRSFTPLSICSRFLTEALDKELVLSYKKLATDLEFAMRLEKTRKTGQAVIEPRIEGIRKRRRVLDPPEILSVEDEGRFSREESAEVKRAEE